MKMKLSKIIIPTIFKATNPSQIKIDNVSKHFKRFGMLDKPVVVDKSGVLIDGYIRYLVAKEAGLDEVDVIVDGLEKNKYIVAKFEHGTKKYHWSNPLNLPIKIGDKVLVRNFDIKQKFSIETNEYSMVTVVDLYESNKRLGHKPVVKILSGNTL